MTADEPLHTYHSYTTDEMQQHAAEFFAEMKRQSVGIATGLLIAAIHHAGLVSLTNTPSPMAFLNELLDRPKHERPYLLLVVGYPAADARVPSITKKALDELVSFV